MKYLIFLLILVSTQLQAQKNYDIFNEKHKLIRVNQTEKKVDSFLYKNKGKLFYIRKYEIKNNNLVIYDCPHYEPKETPKMITI